MEWKLEGRRGHQISSGSVEMGYNELGIVIYVDFLGQLPNNHSQQPINTLSYLPFNSTTSFLQSPLSLSSILTPNPISLFFPKNPFHYCYGSLECFSKVINRNRMQEAIRTVDSRPLPHPARLTTGSPLYAVQKFLRETASVQRFKGVNRGTHPESFFQRSPTSKKELPHIVTKLQAQRQHMQETLVHNHRKLNGSFSEYLRSEAQATRSGHLQRRVTKLKKIQEQREQRVEAPPVERDEHTLVESSFRLIPLPNRCFDSLFPALRYNATLFAADKQVYLLGGFHQRGFQGLSLFHKYDQEGKKWTQVRSAGQGPKVSPCFHTVQVYKGNVVVLGGVSFQGQKGKRFNTQLLIFNIQRGEWARARGGLNIKHHASTLFGSTVMISGGINQKEKFNEDLIFITFTGGSLLNPLIFTVRNQSDAHQRISRHKIIQTYELEPTYRNQLTHDGVFSFGGEDQNGVLNNTLLFINVLGKVAQNLDLKFKKWQQIPTNEQKPCPRKDHSFNVINKKGIAILAGGIDQYGGWLDDVWLLDLVRLHWTRVTTTPRIEQSLGTLSGHCACGLGTTVFLYNGNVEKKREKAFWMLETDSNNFRSKKNIFATKLPSFKSIHSEKENYSMAHIIS